MRALIMFVAPIIAAVATATILNKSLSKSLPHHKTGILPVGNARFGEESCPTAALTFSEIGYSRDYHIIQL